MSPQDKKFQLAEFPLTYLIMQIFVGVLILLVKSQIIGS